MIRAVCMTCSGVVLFSLKYFYIALQTILCVLFSSSLKRRSLPLFVLASFSELILNR